MQIRGKPNSTLSFKGFSEPMTGTMIYYSSLLTIFLDFEQSPIKHKIELRRVRPTHIGWTRSDSHMVVAETCLGVSCLR